MPLSEPAAREPLHTRTVTCNGYRRSDGLWDIEGHITDVKTYAFDNDWRGTVRPGDPVHDMWIRLTLTDDFLVTAVEAVTDKSPFEVCGGIAGNFQRLVGLRVAPGWTRKVRELLGGAEACTHLVELLGPVATTAFQTIYPARARERNRRQEAGPPSNERPRLLDSCHAFRSDGEVVRRLWPAHYTGPAPKTED